MRVKPRSYQPSKAEKEADVSIIAAPGLAGRTNRSSLPSIITYRPEPQLSLIAL